MNETDKILNILKENFPGLLGAYIYGSYASNSMTPQSDIDIGFLIYQKISPVKKWEIQEKIAAKLDRNIDLADLKDASVVLRAEVITSGKRIFTANKLECDKFEMQTYSMYADLNETRADILNDYKEKYGRNSPQ